MKINRRHFINVLAGAAVFAAAAASQAQTFTAVTPAQPTENPGKVEVLEFFSYGCPHCSHLQPLLGPWVAKQSADVAFRKVPVTFGRAAWANIAKLYYALEVTGDLARLDGEVFKAVHEQHVNLFEDRAIQDWVAKNGVDQKKFTEAYNSFGVNSKVRRSDQLVQAYKISGVPSLAIDGKYLAGGENLTDMLDNADKLIAKARAEKSGKKK